MIIIIIVIVIIIIPLPESYGAYAHRQTADRVLAEVPRWSSEIC